ncbi:MAG: peptidylprolyl isomerase, partial [Anaerolineae bacterium]|nr:peptidylprolyl isomerase [Anaerolineae bacterium]NIN97445.1 peptidylprolyl isomerase [Anaerolineae bacterium]
MITGCRSAGTETVAGPPTVPPAAEEGRPVLQWPSPPPMEIDPSKSYEAVFTTEIGVFRVRLFADKAPVTVNNFVFLARQGYYDNSTFHRVLPGFMAQGGDPTGTGGGDPGYTFEDEFDPDLQFDRAGLLAMANRGP